MKEVNKKALGMTMLAAIFVGAMFVSFTLTPVVLEKAGYRGWSTIVTAADGDPGSGASGVLEIFIYNHSDDPETTYAANLSAASAYANVSYLDRAEGMFYSNAAYPNGVPYDTQFDIVVKVRFNKTHAYDTTNGFWRADWARANITCADLSIGAETVMNETIIVNDSNAPFLWINYHIADSDGGYGVGFTITHGASVNVTEFKMDAYY